MNFNLVSLLNFTILAAQTAIFVIDLPRTEIIPAFRRLSTRVYYYFHLELPLPKKATTHITYLSISLHKRAIDDHWYNRYRLVQLT